MISRENFYCRYFFLTNYSITKKSTLKKGCLNRAQKVGGFYVPVLFFCRAFSMANSIVTRHEASTVNVQRSTVVRFFSVRCRSCLCLEGQTLNV